MDIYGVIGWPIKHSLSPAMHNAAFKKLGIDAEYKKFEVKPEELEDFLLNKKEVKGFNVTIPHKVKAKEIIDKNNPLEVANADRYYVEVSGAINTVKREGERLRYMNTDPIGFGHSLERDLGLNFKELKDENVLLIGCGGAGRAIIAELTSSGHHVKKVYVYEMNDKIIVDNKKVEFISKDDIKDKMKDCKLLINASPVGMKEGDLSPIDKKLLRKNLCVYDVVYNRQTQLVKDAKGIGAEAVTGEGMLAAQGAFSFSFWTGVAPVDVVDTMRKELDRILG